MEAVESYSRVIWANHAAALFRAAGIPPRGFWFTHYIDRREAESFNIASKLPFDNRRNPC